MLLFILEYIKHLYLFYNFKIYIIKEHKRKSPMIIDIFEGTMDLMKTRP